MKCPVCNEFMNSILNRNFFRCLNCSLIFDNSDYSYSGIKYSSGDIDIIYFKSVEKIFKYVLKELNIIKPFKGKLLDIGCAYGFFMELAKENGWEVEGIEVFSDMVKYCGEMNLKVFDGGLENFNENHSYDVVTLFSVLCLLKDIDLAMNKISNILKKEGILVIREYNSIFHVLMYKIVKFVSFLRVKPFIFHRWNFSPKSLKIFLEKNGFEIIEIANSPLTMGDPYRTGGLLKGWMVSLIKFIYNLFAEFIYYFSFGNILISSSFLVFARKK